MFFFQFGPHVGDVPGPGLLPAQVRRLPGHVAAGPGEDRPQGHQDGWHVFGRCLYAKGAGQSKRQKVNIIFFLDLVILFSSKEAAEILNHLSSYEYCI